MDNDGLRSVRNAFYLGFYQQTITEAKSLQNNSQLASWANIFHHRALAAISPEQVFQAIPQNASTALQAIKQYATYKQAAHDNRELVLDTIKEWLADEEMNKDITLQLIAAHIYIEQGMLKEAAKIVTQQAAENLEKLSLLVSIYLSIDRIDLALKSYKQMQDIDDDDTLTQLAGAWCGIAQGGEKLAEAQSLLEELSEKFGPSVTVLNSIAVCEIKGKNYSNALSSLKQARELSVENKTKVSAETLINYIVALQHLRKTEVIPKVLAELRSSWPNHPFLSKYSELENVFDKQASTYKFKP